MVGRFRDPHQGLLRAAWPGLTASALLVGACSGSGPAQHAAITNSAGNGGSAGSLATGGLAQGGTDLLVPSIEIPECTPVEIAPPVFADQTVQSAFVRELYSWTTEEQVSEIRAGNVLLTRSEREGLGPGYAWELLQQLAADTSEAGQLAAVLTSEAFSKGRYAWPNPWATRMGWPGETYGGNLLRLVLRQDSWLALFQHGTLSVVDASNASVPLPDALAHPERLAGFFFVKDAAVGGPHCGSFSGGGNFYREFIICNENMIEEWSLGTETIRQRLLDDIARLETFFARTRACPERRSAEEWNLLLGCFGQGVGEQGQYEGALAMPSPAYLPAPAQLAALIDTLRADVFEPDPLVVKPGG
jgi:hypothetical protein